MKNAPDEEYISPFSTRYASPEMSRLFSAHFKISTFRKLWTSLAKAEKKLGLPITHVQVAQLEDNIDKIDFIAIHSYEKKFKHDVMAHIHAYGDQCPDAKGIIHLGATSTFVTDNTDLIQTKQGLELISAKLLQILKLLAKIAEKEAETPCLSYTHFQPAQPTTIGKRICLWLQDFFWDVKELDRLVNELPFLGAKGATGTQSSFLALFDGDAKKVKELEVLIARDFGFTKILPLSGQTYTRKIDLNIMNALASFAASAHKMATDIRLLANGGEMFEGFGEEQVGSSAMPYKRNPIYSERICGLARFVISITQNPAYTVATQWLERSLDDSSNRRISIPESFLGIDAICNLLIHLIKNLQIDTSRTKQNLEDEMHHLCLENILMLAVKKGADRQSTHEILRQISNENSEVVAKKLGLDSNELKKCLDPLKLIGRAPDQVREFIKLDLQPFLELHKEKSAKISSVEF